VTDHAEIITSQYLKPDFAPKSQKMPIANMGSDETIEMFSQIYSFSEVTIILYKIAGYFS